MSSSEEFSSTHLNNYHFPPWSNSIHRPHSSASLTNETQPLSIDNRSSSPIVDSTKPKKKIIRHHVKIPIFSRISSPIVLPQRTASPEVLSTNVDQTLLISLDEIRSSVIPVKSTEMNLQITTKKAKNLSKNFPKQIYEHNQLTSERRKRKQQSQNLLEKSSQNESWFQLRKSLSEFKRLSMTNENLSTSIVSMNFRSEKKLRSNQREISSRIYIDPLLVASKPIHRPSANNSSVIDRTIKTREKSSRTSNFSRPRSRLISSISRKSSPEKRRQLLSSELSEADRFVTPSPRFTMKKEIPTSQRRTTSATVTSSFGSRLPTSFEFGSKTDFSSLTPIRSRSANDIKMFNSRSKTPPMPRFLIVADEEHRIESWFHQYPFVLADELIKLFRSKNSSKVCLAAYFIDEYQTSNPNSTAKTFFQGKPFHIHHDWKKFDLIFVSKPVADEIISHLQTIFHSLKSLKKPIPIYQVDHQKELKKQIKNQCRTFQIEQNDK